MLLLYMCWPLIMLIMSSVFTSCKVFYCITCAGGFFSALLGQVHSECKQQLKITVSLTIMCSNFICSSVVKFSVLQHFLPNKSTSWPFFFMGKPIIITMQISSQYNKIQPNLLHFGISVLVYSVTWEHSSGRFELKISSVRVKAVCILFNLCFCSCDLHISSSQHSV